MSRKSSFANLRAGAAAPVPAPVTVPVARSAPAPQDAAGGKGAGDPGARAGQAAASRQGRKQIAGFFSPQMSFAMHMLARRGGRSLQALMVEAFNDVLRKHGENPIGD